MAPLSAKKALFICWLLAGALTGVALSLVGTSASAASTANFKPGQIIDDSIFTNTSTMTVAQVQTFLNSKVPICDTNGAQPSEMNNAGVPDYNNDGIIQRWEWGKYHYSQTTFPCLKDYVDGGVSSAQIIYNAAQKYQINPQVLIVLLQKEQGLVTDTWPTNIQYRSATGYGCPDTAVCDSTYYGLTNQINWAATMFRAILNQSPSWYSPYVLGNNYIQWSPDASCGGSTVNIQNLSTVALYDYTPYRPNQAALDAGYGGPVTCGAYGNRNFFLYFSDWFGPTTGPPYAWRFVYQAAYADAAHTRMVNTNDLKPNTTYYFQVVAQNTGSVTWTNTGPSPVRLGTSGDMNRQSAICDNSWINCSRPAVLTETSVAPWNNGTFNFSIHTPADRFIASNERFNLLAEGVSWMPDIGLVWPVATLPPTPYYYLLSQEFYLDAARTKPADFNLLAPGASYYVRLKVLNGGNTTWMNSGSNPTRLGTSGPNDRASGFYDSSWVAANRPATLQEASVAPGEVGTFEYKVTAPGTYGTYNEYFKPVTEGLSWMNEIGLYLPLTVAPPTPRWSFQSQNFYTDSTKQTAFNLAATPNSQRFYVSLKAVNTGNTTWTNSGPNPTRLGASGPQNRTSAFYDNTWVAANRPATLQEASVAPGEVGTFEFWMKAGIRLDGTTATEHFTPLTEGVSWMNDAGMYVPVTYKSSPTAVSYVSQQAYSDPAMTTPADLSNARLNTKYYLRLTIKNISGTTWTNANSASDLLLGTSNPQNRTSSFYDTSWVGTTRAAKLVQPSVTPGQTGTFQFVILTPSTATTSNEYFQPLVEGSYWLDNLGIYWAISAK